MAICPSINLSKPAKFKREYRLYLVLSTLKCTHWGEIGACEITQWLWNIVMPLMWDHGPRWGLPGIRVTMNKCAANWFSQNSWFGDWSWDTLEVDSVEVTWIQNFTPSSIPQHRFVQKLNEHFPTFICFYLPVHFLLLLKTRKKARMPRGSPFLACPSPVLPAREVPVNLAQSVLSWGVFLVRVFFPLSEDC